MRQTETAKLLALIKTAYPEFELTPEKIQLWHEFLQHMSFDKAQQNLYEHMASNRYAPKIADMYRYNPKSERQRKRNQIVDKEIAFQQWIMDGNDPNAFKWTDDEDDDSTPSLPGHLQLQN